MATRNAVGGRPTRAEAAALDDRIRTAAVATFVERGFAGTSMEEVARRAMVSKPTLYARYPDKQVLFATVIPWALLDRRHDDGEPDGAEDLDAPPPTGADDVLATALTRLATAFLERARDPELVGLLRVMIAESGHFPALAMTTEHLELSPRVRAVTTLLDRHADDGRITDPGAAAEQFVATFAIAPFFFAVVDLDGAVTRDEARLRRDVERFLDGARA